MPIDKALGLLDCLSIVRTNQRLKAIEMPVAPDGVGPVLCHPIVPTVGWYPCRPVERPCMSKKIPFPKIKEALTSAA
jgi:hypothetical protein